MKSILKIYVALLIIGCAANVQSAENILKNADFHRVGAKGMPRRWNLKGDKAAFSRIPGGFSLKASAALSQGYLEVPPGKRMAVRCTVGGDGTFRVMIEWPGTRIPPANAQWEEFTEGWKQISQYAGKTRDVSFEFVAPEGLPQPPRLTMEVRQGKIEFTKFSVSEAGLPSALGRIWKLSGNSKIVADESGTAIRLGFPNFNDPSALLAGVSVKPDTWYELSFEAKAGEKRVNRGGHCPYRIDIKLQGMKEAVSSQWYDLPGSVWHKRTYRFKNAGSGKTADIGFGALPYPVMIRNVAMKEITPKPLEHAELILTSPHSKNSLYHSRPEKTIAGYIRDIDKSAASGTAVLTLNGKTVSSVSLKNLAFSMDAVKLADGEYQLEVSLKDKTGKITRKLTVPIHKLPPSPAEVVCGPDNHYYVNGKRFVPVMVGSIPGNDPEAWSFASANGVNCLGMIGINDETQLFNFLEKAHKYGYMVRILTYFAVTEAGFPAWQKLQQQRLSKRVLNHPALLCHFLVDEPYESGYGLDVMRKSYEWLSKQDPYHPIHINLGPPGTITAQRHYMCSCDSTGVDIYPVGGPWHSALPDKSQTCIEEYTKRYCELAQNRKTILMVLQGYSWGEDSASEIPKHVKYPTADDLRLMTCLAFWGGTNNVQYYCAERVSRPELFYPVFFPFTKELHQVLPLLLDGKCISDRTNTQKVRVRQVEYQGKKYVFVLNMSGASVQAEFELPFGGQAVNSAFEKQKLTARNGKYAVKLPPYGTRLYSVDPLPQVEALPVYTGKDPNPWIRNRKKEVRAMFGTPYTGKANWIWGTAKARQIAGSKVWMARKIKIAKEVKSARIMFAADDFATVYADGMQIAKSVSWVQMTDGDLTADLKKKGEHVILVHAADGLLLPCGFIAEIRIQYADGTAETIVTDSSWVGTDNNPQGDQARINPALIKSWGKVDIVGPFGCYPWKDKIKLPKEKE